MPPQRPLPVSDAALEGFRITREHPRSILAWAGVRFVGAAATALLILTAGGPAADTFAAIVGGQTQVQPQQAVDAFSQMGPSLAVLALLSLIIWALLYTATLRAVLRPGERAFAHIRLSMDEVRQAALALVFMILMILYAQVLSAASRLLIIGAGTLGPLARPLGALVIAALICAFVYPVVRLSLTPALTFAEGRIDLRRAWRLTHERFWSLLGCYLLAILLAAVVGLLGLVIFALFTGLLGLATHGLAGVGDLMRSLSPGAPAAVLFTQFGIADAIGGALLNTLLYTILAAPGAALVKSLLCGQAPVGAATPPAGGQAAPGSPWGGRL